MDAHAAAGSPAEVDEAVQATAYLAAACRAAETRRDEPRLRDELAELFVAARPAGAPAYQGLLAAGGDEVVARTVLLDQLLLRAVGDGPPPVVVNLGAGFCTRAHRLDLSACPRLLELDAAPVLAVKARVLTGHPPRCPVRRLPLDLRDRAGLAAVLAAHTAGATRVVVVSEGLLPYLPATAVTALADTLGTALPGRVEWLTDVVSVESARQMGQLARSVGGRVELFGLTSLAPFTRAGWSATDYRILPVPRRGPVGRRPPGPARPTSHQVVDGVVALHRQPPHS